VAPSGRFEGLIARLDYHDAGEVIGELKEGAAGVLSRFNALEAGLDAGDAELAKLRGGSVSGLPRLGEDVLPIGNLFIDAILKERRKLRERRTGWRQRVHPWEGARATTS
jgi:hypothetical protein